MRSKVLRHPVLRLITRVRGQEWIQDQERNQPRAGSAFPCYELGDLPHQATWASPASFRKSPCLPRRFFDGSNDGS